MVKRRPVAAPLVSTKEWPLSGSQPLGESCHADEVRAAFAGWPDVTALLLGDAHDSSSHACPDDFHRRRRRLQAQPQRCKEVWPNVEASVYGAQRPRANAELAANHTSISPNGGALMVAWYRQWEHFSRAEHLRREPGFRRVLTQPRGLAHDGP